MDHLTQFNKHSSVLFTRQYGITVLFINPKLEIVNRGMNKRVKIICIYIKEVNNLNDVLSLVYAYS